jgi:hypothetical protein
MNLVCSDFLSSLDLKYPKGEVTSESVGYNTKCNMWTE